MYCKATLIEFHALSRVAVFEFTTDEHTPELPTSELPTVIKTLTLTEIEIALADDVQHGLRGCARIIFEHPDYWDKLTNEDPANMIGRWSEIDM